MKKVHGILGAGLLTAALVIGSHFSRSQHVAPAFLYPDPSLTPGVAETFDQRVISATVDGQTYSKSHRNVPESLKNDVYARYHITLPVPPGSYEVDHFMPVCAGGSNDIKNLWPQPAKNLWDGQNFGFHEKDRLETYLCSQIKSGNLDPKIAFEKITSDWVAYYQSLNLSQKLGSISNEPVE